MSKVCYERRSHAFFSVFRLLPDSFLLVGKKKLSAIAHQDSHIAASSAAHDVDCAAERAHDVVAISDASDTWNGRQFAATSSCKFFSCPHPVTLALMKRSFLFFFWIFFADLVSFFSRLALIVQLLHYSDWR